ncbi:FAD binding domain-containing protein [Amylocystis lapponica]|nr:FAD binding domain-containing protein [Amylocystis lapponica]
MSSANTVSVLVVGAGPAGLVLALTLAKNGVSVRIIEKEARRSVGQRGSGIVPRSAELYNYLGVLPDIESRGRPLQPMRKYTPAVSSRFPQSTPHTAPTPACPYPDAIMLGQDNHEAILRSHLEKLGVQVEDGTGLQDFEQHDDRVVAHVVKEEAGEMKAHDITCYLVGAGGAKGVVCKLLGLQFLGETHDDMYVVIGDIYVKGLDTDHAWGGASRNVVRLRSTEDEGVFSLLAGGHIDYARLVSDRDELIKFIRSTTDRNDIDIGNVKCISEYRPNVRMVDKFGDGRVFVAGDAAHVHSPSGGQGMNSSIQDSFNLGWKLALVEKGFALPSLLSTYNEERLPVIAAMLQKTTALFHQITSAGSDATPRGSALKQLGAAANAYGGGGILRAGDRAPDAPGLEYATAGPGGASEVTLLFRLFGPAYHTVVLFAADARLVAELRDVRAECPPQMFRTVLVLPRGRPAGAAPDAGADVVVTDRDGHAYEGYAVPEEGLTVVVVRPDGVVGGIVLGAAGLRRYFDGVFARQSLP